MSVLKRNNKTLIAVVTCCIIVGTYYFFSSKKPKGESNDGENDHEIESSEDMDRLLGSYNSMLTDEDVAKILSRQS